MDDLNQNHRRNLFERGGGQPHAPRAPQGAATPLRSYDDGYQPPPDGDADRSPLSSEEVADEAAMALALDATEYKPWVLQRGRSRPAMMLHLRRFEPKSGLWMGWQMSYPHLIAVEYVGDKMLSLDFGTRQFVIEGRGLQDLAQPLQRGAVLAIQEYSTDHWNSIDLANVVTSIIRP